MLDPAGLLENLLAVGHSPVDLIRPLAGQQQRRAGHQDRRLAFGIIVPVTSLKWTVPRGGTTCDGDIAATVIPPYPPETSCANPWVKRSSAALVAPYIAPPRTT